MKDVIVQFPISIKKFEKHHELKDDILGAINRQEQTHSLFSAGNNISRCDWETSRFDRSREWVVIIKDPLADHLSEWCSLLGYNNFLIDVIWFQQYANGSQHGWHIHSGNMTNVYYLDFPKDSPKTEWINPIDNTTHQFDVEEGDIVTFPSWVKHRAPENKSNDMKTIISWNFDLVLKDGY